MPRPVKTYTLRSGRATCRATEQPIVVTLYRRARGEMGARYRICIDDADDSMGADGARKIAAQLIRFANYIDHRRGRHERVAPTAAPVANSVQSWWHFLNTEEGRDQTMAHAMRTQSRTSLCGIPLEHIGAEEIADADTAYMEDEEFCPQCLAAGATKPAVPDDTHTLDLDEVGEEPLARTHIAITDEKSARGFINAIKGRIDREPPAGLVKLVKQARKYRKP